MTHMGKRNLEFHHQMSDGWVKPMDEEVTCEISKFAGDTKIASWVNTLNDVRSLQRTLDKLNVWANRWEMDFNVKKCGVTQIGKRNLVSVPDEWWVGQINRWRQKSWNSNI